MTSKKTLISYLRKQDINQKAREKVLSFLDEWREREIPLWGCENKKADFRISLIFGRAFAQDMLVRFFAPVCPDYPADSRSAQLGTGLGETIPPVLSLMRDIIPLIKKYGFPYQFTVLLADTEADLKEVVELLANNSVEDFLRRCKRTIDAAKATAPDLFSKPENKIIAFSDYFEGRWHQMQYFWEETVRQKLEKDNKLRQSLSSIALKREEKYSKQLGRICSTDDCSSMAIRHYAQYCALGYWMRRHEGPIMVNEDSPNLRAIRRPFLIDREKNSILPEVGDQRLRVPVIVLK